MNPRLIYVAVVTLVACIAVDCRELHAQTLTYEFTGTITEVTTNENNVIPGLAPSDSFTGFVIFDSSGWQQTEGIVFTSINGVDLLFDGPFIYGNVDVAPSHYSIRVAADTFGDIGASTFSAGNFGPDLADTDGSAGYSVAFPMELNLAHFETNVFRIWGIHVPTNNSIFATGELNTFTRVPEPTSLGLFALCATWIAFGRTRRSILS